MPVRQVAHRPRDERRVFRSKHKHFRIGLTVVHAVLYFVKRIRAGLDRATSPAVAGIPNDPEEPGPPVAAGEGMKIAERSQRGLLHSILCIVVIPHERTR